MILKEAAYVVVYRSIGKEMIEYDVDEEPGRGRGRGGRGRTNA
jgi:hypothetical protein